MKSQLRLISKKSLLGSEVEEEVGKYEFDLAEYIGKQSVKDKVCVNYNEAPEFLISPARAKTLESLDAEKW